MYFFTNLFIKIIRTNNAFVFGISILFIGSCSFAAYFLEPQTFGNPFNGFWWVMTTVTTVGYGDLSPHTVPGKCLGVVVFVFGIGLISVTISKVIDAVFSHQRKKEEGKVKYSGEQHFAIIGWGRSAQNAIEEILSTDPRAEIVLIDELEKTPTKLHRVHYVQGSPIHAHTLEAANLSKARAVFIFSDEVTQYQNYIRDTAFIDGKTLLIATAVERNYGHVRTIVEIRDKANLPSFQHIKIDEFIFGSEAVSQLAVRSAFSPGTSGILTQLLTTREGEDLFEIPARPEWRTFRDAFDALLDRGATLISDGTELNINRRLSEAIPPQARLFVICDKGTYQKLIRK